MLSDQPTLLSSRVRPIVAALAVVSALAVVVATILDIRAIGWTGPSSIALLASGFLLVTGWQLARGAPLVSAEANARGQRLLDRLETSPILQALIPILGAALVVDYLREHHYLLATAGAAVWLWCVLYARLAGNQNRAIMQSILASTTAGGAAGLGVALLYATPALVPTGVGLLAGAVGMALLHLALRIIFP